MIWFLLMIFIGLVLGLVYGWVINPIRTGSASPSSLRADYKADYVLMIAEIYAADGNLDSAVQRLAPMGHDPQKVVAEGFLAAGKLGYPVSDLEQISRLAQALQGLSPSAGSRDGS